MFYRRKGFTLLELMVVVIIVGILASLALPRFITATRKAKEAEAMSILGSLRAAQIRYYLENNETYAVNLADLDTDITVSKYFTYTVGAAPNIATATPTAACAGCGTFKIDEDGNITP